MGQDYRHFSLEERCQIASLRAQGHSIRQIAAAVDRAVMESDTKRARAGRAYVFTDLLRQRGVSDIVSFIERQGGLAEVG